MKINIMTTLTFHIILILISKSKHYDYIQMSI